MDEDKKALEENGGTWENSHHRLSRDAVDLMNDTITDNINAIVGENDILWHLGDFAFARREDYIRKCNFYRYRLKCQNINMVWGNHDEPHLIHSLFKENHTLNMIHVQGQRIVLNHYAMAVWEKSHHKTINLYGHSHSNAESWLDKMMPGRRSMDVGVDNAYRLLGQYRPFTFDEILNLLKSREGHNIGDHHS